MFHFVSFFSFYLVLRRFYCRKKYALETINTHNINITCKRFDICERTENTSLETALHTLSERWKEERKKPVFSYIVSYSDFTDISLLLLQRRLAGLMLTPIVFVFTSLFRIVESQQRKKNSVSSTSKRVFHVENAEAIFLRCACLRLSRAFILIWPCVMQKHFPSALSGFISRVFSSASPRFSVPSLGTKIQSISTFPLMIFHQRGFPRWNFPQFLHFCHFNEVFVML